MIIINFSSNGKFADTITTPEMQAVYSKLPAYRKSFAYEMTALTFGLNATQVTCLQAISNINFN